MKPFRALVASLLGLAVLASAPPAPAQPYGLPWVTSITTDPSPPCPDSSYQLVVRGVFPTACGRVLDARILGPTTVELRVQTPYPAAAFCLPDSVPWEHRLEMPGLPGGRQHVMAMRMIVVDETLPAAPVLRVVDIEVPLSVAASCDSVPRPNPIEFVNRVFIFATGPDDVPRPWICPTDPVIVSAVGVFPNDCYMLRKVELLPSPIMSPLPAPPIVRFVFDDMGCTDRVCAEVATKWHARVALPPLPMGNYTLIVEAATVTCRDSVVPGDPFGNTTYPFHVTSPDSCGPNPGDACLWASWDHAQNSGGCDAELDIEGRAAVTMNLMTNVALAGLEGEIHVSPPSGGLGIERLVPIGPAAGMNIQSTRTPDGMKFVLFATAGAPIPPTDVMSGIPILRVELAGTPRPALHPAPERWHVMAGPLLGADANAKPVTPCPIRTLDLVAEAATVCRRSSCDYNRDGREDVLDLVGMVRCLHGLPPCDSGAVGAVDCQRDGDFDLDDIVCCAISMLGARPCVDCPADSTRPAPNVALAFDEPEMTAAGLRVPLRVSGSGLVGGARLVLRYPQSGYRLAAIETNRLPSGWIALHAPKGDELGVALLRLGGAELSVDDRLDLALVLEPIEGANGAGEVRVTEAEFSGTDGVRLAVSGVTPSVPIGDPGALALSPATPNPFDASTSFRLTLGSRAQVSIGIYDLAGRRVTAIHDGLLPVGSHAFSWDGRSDDGTRAPGGVYFYRAESGGRMTARKMVLLGSR